MKLDPGHVTFFSGSTLGSYVGRHCARWGYGIIDRIARIAHHPSSYSCTITADEQSRLISARLHIGLGKSRFRTRHITLPSLCYAAAVKDGLDQTQRMCVKVAFKACITMADGTELEVVVCPKPYNSYRTTDALERLKREALCATRTYASLLSAAECFELHVAG